jgi:hypothetical protein
VRSGSSPRQSKSNERGRSTKAPPTVVVHEGDLDPAWHLFDLPELNLLILPPTAAAVSRGHPTR